MKLCFFFVEIIVRKFSKGSITENESGINNSGHILFSIRSNVAVADKLTLRSRRRYRGIVISENAKQTTEIIVMFLTDLFAQSPAKANADLLGIWCTAAPGVLLLG